MPSVLKIWEPKPPGILWATLGLLRDCFTFLLFCDGISQILVAMNSNLMIVVVQFKGRLKINFLLLSICFVNVNDAFCFLCFLGDWMK